MVVVFFFVYTRDLKTNCREKEGFVISGMARLSVIVTQMSGNVSCFIATSQLMKLAFSFDFIGTIFQIILNMKVNSVDFKDNGKINALLCKR